MSLERTILALHGEAGQRWLDTLPFLLTEYAQRWDLEIGAPFENLSYNYVALARPVDGRVAVIKAGFPNDELRAEIAALWYFDGHGTLRLYEADDERCVFLLEWADPGVSLWEMDDEKATSILLDAMKELWRTYKGNYPFPTVGDWGRGFARLRERHGGGTGPLDEKLVEKAEKIFMELLASSEDAVLLHGDLHHGNILSAQRQPWLVIDPKGILGEPAYEVGAFLRNPMPGLLERGNPRALMLRRVDQIVERFGFDRQRVIGWGMSQAVLSAIWCDEDHLPCGEGAMACAELMDQ